MVVVRRRPSSSLTGVLWLNGARWDLGCNVVRFSRIIVTFSSSLFLLLRVAIQSDGFFAATRAYFSNRNICSR